MNSNNDVMDTITGEMITLHDAIKREVCVESLDGGQLEYLTNQIERLTDIVEILMIRTGFDLDDVNHLEGYDRYTRDEFNK